MLRFLSLVRLWPVVDDIQFVLSICVGAREYIDRLALNLAHCEATEQDFPLVIRGPQLSAVLRIVNLVRSILDKLPA